VVSAIHEGNKSRLIHGIPLWGIPFWGIPLWALWVLQNGLAEALAEAETKAMFEQEGF